MKIAVKNKFGITVYIPEEKLEQWKAAQEKLTEEDLKPSAESDALLKQALNKLKIKG